MDIITGVILIVAVVIVVDLQRYLSKKPNRWLGLILPAVSFVFSIGFCIFVLFGAIGEKHMVNMADGSSYSFETQQQTDAFLSTVDSQDILDVFHISAVQPKVMGVVIPSPVGLFLSLNIITLLFLMIYFRYKRYRRLRLLPN